MAGVCCLSRGGANFGEMAWPGAAAVRVALLLLSTVQSSWGFWVPPTAGAEALRCFTPGHRAVCRRTSSGLLMSGEDASEGEHLH